VAQNFDTNNLRKVEMLGLNRRAFLQTGSLLAGVGTAGLAWGQDNSQPQPTQPKFPPAPPTFEPTALFLTWQRDPTTTMTIQWVGSENDGLERPIWYRAEDSDIWLSAPHTARPFPMTQRWLFRSELTGLKPDTDYLFHVGLDSPRERFRTMPAKNTNSITFVSGGDAGIVEAAVQTNKLAAAQRPQFVVLGGDLAYENGMSPGVFLQFLKNYSRDVRDERQRLIPMLGCIGNHEVQGGYNQPRTKAPFFYSIFDGLYPEKGFASLDFGDYMSLVLLDTGHTTPIAGEQTDWLEKTLKERELCPNVFAFNHVPAYPSHRDMGSDGENETGTGAGNRKHWCPLFERYKVDAVFEHHDHTFKRSHRLQDGMIHPNGVLYLGDGSWGKIRRPLPVEKRPYLAVAEEAFHMSVHRVEGHERFHVALNEAGRMVDVCTSTKRLNLGS
jgi:hypothetical protein